MPHFDGPRQGWDEHSQGTVVFEVDLELWSDSGRLKHIDIQEQGAWLTEVIGNALRKIEPGDDVKIHRVRYLGEQPASENSFINEVEIGG